MTEELVERHSNILMYQSEDGKTRIDVLLENETVWLTQMAMIELYQTTKQNISLHLKNVYEEGELDREPTVKEYLTVRQEFFLPVPFSHLPFPFLHSFISKNGGSCFLTAMTCFLPVPLLSLLLFDFFLKKY